MKRRLLRLYGLHYAYPGMGGHIHIGIDGPWDARRILGTVPVNLKGRNMDNVNIGVALSGNAVKHFQPVENGPSG